MGIVSGIVFFVRALLSDRAAIAAENLAPRHQLGALQRSVKRPRLRQRDRILWVWLSRLWAEADVAAGAPTNADGTINLAHYAAWLVKMFGHEDRRRMGRT